MPADTGHVYRSLMQCKRSRLQMALNPHAAESISCTYRNRNSIQTAYNIK